MLISPANFMMLLATYGNGQKHPSIRLRALTYILYMSTLLHQHSTISITSSKAVVGYLQVTKQ